MPHTGLSYTPKDPSESVAGFNDSRESDGFQSIRTAQQKSLT